MPVLIDVLGSLFPFRARPDRVSQCANATRITISIGQAAVTIMYSRYRTWLLRCADKSYGYEIIYES